MVSGQATGASWCGYDLVVAASPAVTCAFIRPDGRRCLQTILVDGSDRCVAHTPGLHDLKRAGRKGGSVPKGMGGRPGKSLRSYLQRHIEPAHVLRAVQTGLDSDDERLRLAASKTVIGDVFGVQDRDEETEFAAPLVDHDFPAILVELEEIGVLMSEPSLVKFTFGLRRVWGTASPEERDLYVAEVGRLQR